MTNAYSRSQRCLVNVYHLAPQISEAFLSSLLLGAIAIKRRPLIHLTDDALSLSLSACFFTHPLHDVLARTRDSSKTPRPCSLCIQHVRQNFWAQIILDPYRRPLTLTFLLVSTRGLFQDMMFELLHDSTFFEDAPEVVVQPLPCGTNYSNTLFHTPSKKSLFELFDRKRMTTFNKNFMLNILLNLEWKINNI